jgi:cyclopropane-fatty-acyl-phospholipid synthase
MTTSQASRRSDLRTHDGANALAGAISKLLGTRDWRLELWDGRTVMPEGHERFRITFHSKDGIDRLLGAFPSRAFGRAYAEGSIDVYPLRPFLEAVSNVTLKEEALALPLLIGAALTLGARPSGEFLKEGEAHLRGRRHSRSRDAAAIRHHYDVPVEFYRLWLDSTLTYSCAYFEDVNEDIDTAEAAKLERVCKKLRLQPGESLLDIGCGWGSLPIHAARFHDARVVGLTLSPAQAEVARRRAREYGVEDHVEIRLADYRDPLGTTFDAVATIGMLEHVGRKNIPRLARSIVDALRPGGRALVHGITTWPGHPIQRGSFIDAFIFPDGELEDAGYLCTEIERVGMEVRDVESLREHYALTLSRWRERLLASWDKAERIIGRERLRLWELYLTGSEVGFSTNKLSIHQILAVRANDRGQSGVPLTRDDWYA